MHLEFSICSLINKDLNHFSKGQMKVIIKVKLHYLANIKGNKENRIVKV